MACISFWATYHQQNSYQEFALFFYDQFGGDYIAVVWRPNICIPHSFKVRVHTGKLFYLMVTGVPSQLQKARQKKSMAFSSV